jgi:TATA-binding protein-associated factor Taf7
MYNQAIKQSVVKENENDNDNDNDNDNENENENENDNENENENEICKKNLIYGAIQWKSRHFKIARFNLNPISVILRRTSQSLNQ